MKKTITIIALMSVSLMQARWWEKATVAQKESAIVGDKSTGMRLEGCDCATNPECCD